MSADHRPHFPNHVRDLAPELARLAVFYVAIGRGPEDHRPAEDKTVSGCESQRCAIRASGGVRPATNG
jgi:hypothetical protein